MVLVMRISCFCGATWEAEENPSLCPLCGEPAFLPEVDPRDMDAMLVELQTILDEHGIVGD